ncbi:iron complex outermembrane receptor protein [Rheinheimera pacifica]|uniref:TonB-dependent receptor plug domain-containing protein n=1 Tax=Rheinheimera pacifica TaxID=173990 RepID=UPI00216A0BA8|nr:TonB-dependent receptor [Rheinheimera pacifica]MCS4309192.1 iron complex outermembrane receptor protein [Rheinheimera pacifica]
MGREYSMTKTRLAISIGLLLSSWQVLSSEQNATDAELETIVVLGSRLVSGLGLDDQVASSLDAGQIRQFNRNNVGDALNLLSGVTLSQNSRNESMVSVRGFDSRQVPLYIDGIPVYVPYDGYIDFNRFTTADLAAIQVTKGFSSVAYGPNTLGGAINLISRKPSEPFEADLSLGAGSANQYKAATNIGIRQNKWYLQAGASYIDSDGFKLSDDFGATATENGGLRNNGYYKDNKLSFKLGYLPAEGEEHLLSVYRQQGEKGQPPSTDPAYARFWQWPYWDKEGVYLVSRNRLGETEKLTVRLYHDKYSNEVNSFTDASYSELKTSGSGSVGSGRSIYKDTTGGGSILLESLRFTDHHLRLVSHIKTERHLELDAAGTRNTEYKDTLWSIAAEDNIQLTDATVLAVGVSHHQLKPDSVFNLGNPYSLPGKKTATDTQVGLFYSLSADARLYATVAAKTRLPSLKDRYSQRLGRFIENPQLEAEQAINYELGYQQHLAENSVLEIALFYSDINDKIQAVADVSGTLSQMQNIGRVETSGLELGWQTQLSPVWHLGGNYTFTRLRNKTDQNNRITDIPRHKLMLHSQWLLTQQLQLQLQAEHNSSRFASATRELTGFTVLNLSANYQLPANWQLSLGLNNATDKYYELADGFPTAGRSWFINLFYSF